MDKNLIALYFLLADSGRLAALSSLKESHPVNLFAHLILTLQKT